MRPPPVPAPVPPARAPACAPMGATVSSAPARTAAVRPPRCLLDIPSPCPGPVSGPLRGRLRGCPAARGRGAECAGAVAQTRNGTEGGQRHSDSHVCAMHEHEPATWGDSHVRAIPRWPRRVIPRRRTAEEPCWRRHGQTESGRAGRTWRTDAPTEHAHTRGRPGRAGGARLPACRPRRPRRRTTARASARASTSAIKAGMTIEKLGKVLHGQRPSPTPTARASSASAGTSPARSGSPTSTSPCATTSPSSAAARSTRRPWTSSCALIAGRGGRSPVTRPQ